MILSACGLICSDCEFFGAQCSGCHAVKGQTFWALEHMPTKTCPLYDCSVNKLHFKDCGDCGELPCKMFREMKDPNSSDEEHRQGLIDRVARLRAITMLLILLMTIGSMVVSAQYHAQDSILFETSTVPVKIWESPTNTWQIGAPQKTYLNAAWSQPQGIITETSIPYPVNTNSTFSFVINSKSLKLDFATYISFMQKYDTDTLVDRGIIEASYNGGGVWCELGNTGWTCPDGPALISWDQDSAVASHKKYNHLAVTSGKSDGWLFSRCHLYWIIFDNAPGGIIPDSVMVRFIFTSDGSASGKEGWLIDNIVFGYEDYFTGVSETPVSHSSLAILPNPVTGQSALKYDPSGQPVNITIFDRAGRLISKTTNVNPGNFKLNRQDFTPGLYLLKVENQQGKSQTTRFIVQ